MTGGTPVGEKKKLMMHSVHFKYCVSVKIMSILTCLWPFTEMEVKFKKESLNLTCAIFLFFFFCFWLFFLVPVTTYYVVMTYINYSHTAKMEAIFSKSI